MTKSYMEDIEVKNEELLGILEDYRELFLAEDSKKYFFSQCLNEKDRRDYWVGERHLNEILSQGGRHEGFPDCCYSKEVSAHREGHRFYTDDAPALFKKNTTAQISSCNSRLMSFLGARYTALSAIYPPGGFISWHNNANASAYNLIFTWSETGEGNFKYVDPITKEIVVMPDKKGWQCKAAYFGNYREPESLFYHAAETDCWRITLSFTFNTDDASIDYRRDVIEDIKTP